MHIYTHAITFTHLLCRIRRFSERVSNDNNNDDFVTFRTKPILVSISINFILMFVLIFNFYSQILKQKKGEENRTKTFGNCVNGVFIVHKFARDLITYTHFKRIDNTRIGIKQLSVEIIINFDQLTHSKWNKTNTRTHHILKIVVVTCGIVSLATTKKGSAMSSVIFATMYFIIILLLR